MLIPITIFSHYIELAGVRNAALGGTGISSSNDISAAIWNPSLLGRFRKIEFISDSRKYFWELENDDFMFNYASISYPFESVGTFVFSGSFFNAREYKENKVGLHYGNQLIYNKLFYGFSAYSYTIGYGQNEYTVNDPFFKNFGYGKTTIDGDIGMTFFPNRKLQFGLMIYNILRSDFALDPDNTDRLPMIFGYGFTYNMKKLKAIMEIKYEMAEFAEDNQYYYSGGLEYELNNRIDLRAGINKTKFTAGFGFRIVKKDLLSKFHDPVTSTAYINTRSYEVCLDYCVQYPYNGIESSYGDHFFGIKLNYNNSTTEAEKYTTHVPPKVEKEYVTEVIVDSLYERTKIDTSFFREQMKIDTVYITKVVYDTVIVIEKVPDSTMVRTSRDLAVAQSKLRNLTNVNKAHSHLLNALKFFYANEYDKAIKECNIAVNIAPDLSITYIRLGSIYYRLGAIAYNNNNRFEAQQYFNKCRENWNEAKRITPNHPELKELAKNYFKDGKVYYKKEVF